MKVVNQLNHHARQRYREAHSQITKALELENHIKENLLNPRVNFWEWVAYDDDVLPGKCRPTEFIAFYILIEDIRKHGIKVPIKVEFKNRYFDVRNGHHRLAIAEILGIILVPLEFYEEPKN